MTRKNNHITRREFLRLSALGAGGLLLRGRAFARELALPSFPDANHLGRAVAFGLPVRARPDADSPMVRQLAEDEIIPVYRRMVGNHPYRFSQTFVETEGGYVWSPDIQPVQNQPNQPLQALPETSLGPGMWVEVTVPYVDLALINPPARAPWLRYRVETGLQPRMFHSQVVWVDQVQANEAGQVLYRINERFGYGDLFWAEAAAFKPIDPASLNPISPEVEEKRIVVDVTRQTMSCFEGNTEVYFARVSTGALYNAFGERVNTWGTPLGKHRIWRKTVSLPLSGGSAAAGWDLPAVGWISLFVGSGVAFHSTYWHNNYGVPTSRGCVNCSPEDSRWVFQWTLPHVAYDPGDATVEMPGGTQIEVIES